MEPFQPIPKTAEVVLSGVIFGEPWANTLYFEHPTGWNLLDLTQLTANLGNWWVTNMRPLSHAGMTLTDVVGTDLSTQFGLQAQQGYSSTGNRAGSGAPNNIAAMVTFFTGIRGRAFKGRNFVSGMVESDFTGNFFESAYIDDLLGAYGEIPSAVLVTGVDHVVVTRNVNGIRLDDGIVSDVLDYRGNTKVHPMKRRLPGYD